MVRIAQGCSDGEADIYFINVAGIMTKFIFTGNSVELLSDRKLKVGYSKSANGEVEEFTVTDENGIKYVFSDYERTEYMAGKHSGTVGSGFNTAAYWKAYTSSKLWTPIGNSNALKDYISSWYLSEVIHPHTSGKIDFNYVSEQIAYEGNVQVQLTGNLQEISFTSTRYNVLGKRLSNISWDGGRIDFVPSTLARKDVDDLDFRGNTQDAKSLAQIVIKGLPSESSIDKHTIKTYSFVISPVDAYGYESQHYSDKQSVFKRNFLTSILTDGSAYKFEYDDTQLPSRISAEQDYWGYYNGNGAYNPLPKTYEHHYTPSVSSPTVVRSRYCVYPLSGLSNTTLFGSDRSPDYSKIAAGILKKITYPTGGSTSFFYEANEFDFGGTTKQGAGLRISRTEHSDGLSYFPLTSSYTYSPGKVISIPHYTSTIHLTTSQGTGPSYPLTDYTDVTYIKTSSSRNKLELTQGSFVGYSNVTVRQSGRGSISYVYDVTGDFDDDQLVSLGNGEYLFDVENPRIADLGTDSYSIGLSTYTYYSNGSGTTETDTRFYDNYPFAPTPSYDWNRGQILNETHKNQSGNTVRTINYSYDIDMDLVRPKIYAAKSEFYGTNKIKFNRYYFTNGVKRLRTVTNTQYFSNGSQSTITTAYNNYSAVDEIAREIVTTKENGETYIERTTYPFEYGANSINLDPESKIFLYMQQANMKAFPVERTTTYNDGSGEKVIKSELYKYKRFNLKPQLYETHALDLSAPILESGFNYFTLGNPHTNDSRYDLKSRVTHYNAEGLPEQIYDAEMDRFSAYTYSYNNEQVEAAAQDCGILNTDFSVLSFSAKNEFNGWTHNASNSYKLYPSGVAPEPGFIGKLSRRVEPATSSSVPNDGPSITIIPTVSDRDMILSAWVKTPGGFGANKGRLTLYASNLGNITNAKKITEVYFSGIVGKWQYVEAKLDLDYLKSLYGSTINVQAKFSNLDPTYYYEIDEIRLYPEGGDISTFAYKSGAGTITGTLDPENTKRSYGYESEDKLDVISDHEGYIAEEYDYHISNEITEETFNADFVYHSNAYPNLIAYYKEGDWYKWTIDGNTVYEGLTYLQYGILERSYAEFTLTSLSSGSHTVKLEITKDGVTKNKVKTIVVP